MADQRFDGVRREPAINLPGSVIFCIVALTCVHMARVYLLDDQGDAALLRLLAFTPGQFTYGFSPDAIAAELTRLAREGVVNRLEVAQYFLGDGVQFWTPLTYALLHADWTHLGVNCLWLAAFGAPVATRFRTGRFFGLIIVTTIFGALAHYLAHPVDLTPVIGASGAVSGVMGAAVRFVFRPGAPLGPALYEPLPPGVSVRLPALGVWESLRDRRVLQFTAIWFVINLVVGLLAAPLGIVESGIAWEAHAGGFLAGFLLFQMFDPIRPAPPSEDFQPS